jgi:predicted RNase H-like HicB family nuclease
MERIMAHRGDGMDIRKPPQSAGSYDLRFEIEIELEDDGRWLAEIPELSGVLAYAPTELEAKARAYALALRVLADRIENSRDVPASLNLICASA